MILRDENETQRFGEELGKILRAGDVVALYGELGTGKTAFTRGIAKGLGIKAPVVSPTYLILQIYEDGILPLYHYDVYRLSHPEEVFETGYEEIIEGQGVVVIEWAENIAPLLPESRLDIFLTYHPFGSPSSNLMGREIKLLPQGEAKGRVWLSF